MPRPNLRAHLQMIAAGDAKLPRGNVLPDAHFKAAERISKATVHLLRPRQGEAITAPSEILPLLP